MKIFDYCGRWVPVEKKYPANPRSVSEIKPYIVTCRNFAVAISLSYMGNGEFQDINGHSEIYDVIAWMDMPKVYKPKR